MFKIATFGSIMSPKWIRVYYLCGIPVWRKDMNKHYAKFLDRNLKRK